MAGYMVYWPQDRVKELQKAGDEGPCPDACDYLGESGGYCISNYFNKEEILCDGASFCGTSGTRL